MTTGRISSEADNLSLAIELAKISERQLQLGSQIKTVLDTQKEQGIKINKIEVKLASAAAVVSVCSAALAFGINYLFKKFGG